MNGRSRGGGCIAGEPDPVAQELLGLLSGRVGLASGDGKSAASGDGRGYRPEQQDIVFIGDHGGYQKAMARAAAAMNQEWSSTSVRAYAIDEYYQAATVDFPKLLREKGFKEFEAICKRQNGRRICPISASDQRVPIVRLF